MRTDIKKPVNQKKYSDDKKDVQKNEKI